MLCSFYRPGGRLVVLFEQLDDSCHVEVSTLLVKGLLEHIPRRADGRHRIISAGRLHRVVEILRLAD